MVQKSTPMPSADSPTSESAALEEELSESLSRLVLDQATGTSSSHPNYTLGTEQKDDQYGYGYQAKAPLTNLRRPEFCSVYPWQLPPQEYSTLLVFPQEDLLSQLIRLYFTHQNPLYPVLHRPTFEKSVLEGLHLYDRTFGSLVLAVCACASRLSDDPRVLCDSTHRFSAGWEWFRQIKLIRANITLCPPTIYELQLFCLAIPYLGNCSTYHSVTILISIGLRFAQQMGAHRRKSGKPTVESELLKRSFWVLYVLDVLISSYLGRPRAISNDDFDVDLPIECDDEYWITPDPEQAFKQPPGQPAYVVYWNTFVKLLDIMSFAQRTIYTVRRSDFWTSMGLSGTQWNEKVVSEIDRSLNRWIDSIPSHLKWDPQQAHQIFFQQSSSLYASYYWVQMFVHKAFIPKRGTTPTTTLPSMTICVNAARSCCRVMEIHHRRGFLLPMANVFMALYTSAIVLLLNAWRGKHLRTSAEPKKEMQDVYSCIDMLRLYEARWQSGGAYVDALRELVVVTKMHEDNPNPQLLSPSKIQDTGIQPRTTTVDYSHTNSKRSGGVQDEGFASNDTDPDSGFAISSYLNESIPNPSTSNEVYSDFISNHPLSSTELGNLPLYGGPFSSVFNDSGQNSGGGMSTWSPHTWMNAESSGEQHVNIDRDNRNNQSPSGPWTSSEEMISDDPLAMPTDAVLDEWDTYMNQMMNGWMG
ncbi:Gypsy retrotransposon integrase-like protein 1, variant 2 [Stygiomarasmius scandens]